MTTIICATNRPENQTRKVVEAYYEIVKSSGDEVTVFSLEDLPQDFIFSDSYGQRTDSFQTLLESNIYPAERLIIISPEYNGSYPGIFKAFLDANDPKIWPGKRVALVGVAAGRAGNIRGMDHLVQVCHHLGMVVLPNQIPISQLFKLIDEEGEFSHSSTIELLENQYNQLRTIS